MLRTDDRQHRGLRRPPGRRRRPAGEGRLRRPGHPDLPRTQRSPTTSGSAPHLNPRWDDAVARSRIGRLGLDPAQRAGRLSGGQRAQLALTLGLAKRPELLVLDEPVASLDPLARREFLQVLMEAVAEHELSVLLSSHVVSDLERVCDHLVVLVDSEVRVEGDVEALLASHHRLTGPRRDIDTLPGDQHVVTASHTDRQTTLVVRTEAPDPRPGVDGRSARARGPRAGLHGTASRQRIGAPPAGGPSMIWLTWRQFRAQAVAVYAAVAAVALVLADHRARLADLARLNANVFDHPDQHRPQPVLRRGHRAGAWPRRSSAPSGALRWSPASSRAGTHRLVWNQSVTRTRWLAMKLGTVTLGAAAAVGVLTVAVNWWAKPLDGALSSTRGSLPSRLTPVTFAMRGIVPVSYAVFAVVLGVDGRRCPPPVPARHGRDPRPVHVRAGRRADVGATAPGAAGDKDRDVQRVPPRRHHR